MEELLLEMELSGVDNPKVFIREGVDNAED